MGKVLNWFSFKGIKSTDFGVYAELLPPIIIAEERVEFKKVTARSGTMQVLEGDAVFEDMVFEIECYMKNIDQLNAITSWLYGNGQLVLPGRPGGYYYGRVVGQIEFARVLKAHEYRRFIVSFRVEPFFYLDDSADIESTESTFWITNPGNIKSVPCITVYGSGDILLSVGKQAVRLTGLTDGIILDGSIMDALSLDRAQLMNGNMSGEFPTLPPGESAIAWMAIEEDGNPGTVTKIVITPRWRCC